MSHGIALTFDFREILLSEIPNSIDVTKSDDFDDKNGTDWWVTRKYNQPLSIDLKAREKDFKDGNKNDDLALETWSIVESNKIGWTRDPSKNTDYILWFWKDTKRWCMLPFPMLCRVFSLNWQDWRSKYKTRKQATEVYGQIAYHSECVFVPRQVVWDSIINHFS